MAGNGGMASQFFPPNFLLQMQQPLPHHHHHHHPQQDHHGHGHGHHQHPHEHHLLPSPHAVHLNPFLQDLGGMPPMLVGSKRPPPSSMYPDAADMDASSHHHHHHHQQQQQDGDGDGEASDDEDGGSAAAGGCGGEKKRRLSVEQVRTLEKSFEVGTKLEPERKLQLARALGLRPRQVAIWFQNRRARWKTKQLEKDYDALRRQFDAARADNDALLANNNKLQAEMVALKGSGGSSRQEAASELINLNVKETEASCSNRSENSSEINLDISRPAAPPVETSPMHRGGTAIQFYASLSRPGAGLDIDQLLHSHGHASSPVVVAPPLKMELGTGNDGDAGDTATTAANFGSLLCGAVDEPAQFWPWVDGHHQFH